MVVAGSRLAGWSLGRGTVVPVGSARGCGPTAAAAAASSSSSDHSMMMVLPAAEDPTSPEERVFPLRDAWSVGSVDISTWCRVVIDAISAFPHIVLLMLALIYMNKPW